MEFVFSDDLSGMSEIFILMNSGRLRGVLRKTLEMSIVMNHEPAVEMTLLNKILAASMSAVGWQCHQGN